MFKEIAQQEVSRYEALIRELRATVPTLRPVPRLNTELQIQAYIKLIAAIELSIEIEEGLNQGETS